MKVKQIDKIKSAFIEAVLYNEALITLSTLLEVSGAASENVVSSLISKARSDRWDITRIVKTPYTYGVVHPDLYLHKSILNSLDDFTEALKLVGLRCLQISVMDKLFPECPYETFSDYYLFPERSLGQALVDQVKADMIDEAVVFYDAHKVWDVDSYTSVGRLRMILIANNFIKNLSINQWGCFESVAQLFNFLAYHKVATVTAKTIFSFFPNLEGMSRINTVIGSFDISSKEGYYTLHVENEPEEPPKFLVREGKPAGKFDNTVLFAKTPKEGELIKPEEQLKVSDTGGLAKAIGVPGSGELISTHELVKQQKSCGGNCTCNKIPDLSILSIEDQKKYIELHRQYKFYKGCMDALYKSAQESQILISNIK